MIARWMKEQDERDHAQGIRHGITSTGDYCPTCLLNGDYMRANDQYRVSEHPGDPMTPQSGSCKPKTPPPRVQG